MGIKHRADSGLSEFWVLSKLRLDGQVRSSEMPYVSYPRTLCTIEMIKFIKIISVISTIILTACGQETILKADNDLKENIKKKVTSGQKSLDLNKLTDFQWDSLIILAPYSYYDKIENQYNINLSQVRHSNIESRDDICQLIFFREGEPVRMIEYPRYPGDFSTNNVEFIKRDSSIFDIVFTTKKTVAGDDWIKLVKQ